jgi:hypothetical protein
MDRESEENTKASESAMAVMDWLSQNRNQYSNDPAAAVAMSRLMGWSCGLW